MVELMYHYVVRHLNRDICVCVCVSLSVFLSLSPLVDTKKYLATHTMYKYGQPIHGQLEVHAKGYADADTEWRADVCY